MRNMTGRDPRGFYTSISHIGKYDYNSVMHYSSFAGSIKSKKCAVFTKKDATTICLPGAERFLIPEMSTLRSGETDSTNVVTSSGVPVATRGVSGDRYSDWDYIRMTASYCEERYCGNQCILDERCNEPHILDQRKKLKRWEEEQARNPHP